jgi:hypothetical protein
VILMADDLRERLNAAIAQLLAAQEAWCEADISADKLISILQAHDLYLMHWPERRVSAKMELASRTPAGPMLVRANDLSGMGVRFSVEAQLTGAALLAQFSYQEAAMLGSWLVARGMMAAQRSPKHDLPPRDPDDSPGEPDPAIAPIHDLSV